MGTKMLDEVMAEFDLAVGIQVELGVTKQEAEERVLAGLLINVKEIALGHIDEQSKEKICELINDIHLIIIARGLA